ncbi:MAG TPA: terminase small subunit [Gallionella sp.]|nr:terminase small subunit [Gallionella sp.]
MASKKKQSGSSQLSKEKRELLFVEAFLSNGGNKTQAAIKAGYKANSAAKQGSRMSKLPHILSMIRQRQDKLAEKHRLNTDTVIGELSKIVHADLRKLFTENGALLEVKDWPDAIAGAVSSLEVDELFDGQGKERKQIGYTKKIKLWDKNSAIEKAMKHLGMFERDNEQKLNPLREFLEQCSGKALPIASDD